MNTKVARVAGGHVLAALGRPFELQRAPDRLAALLRDLAAEIGAESPALHAVTMTAELSQMFRSKPEGVAFVIDAVETAFPSDEIRVFAVDNRFLRPDEARTQPLAVAAANWSATAHAVAASHLSANSLVLEAVAESNAGALVPSAGNGVPGNAKHKRVPGVDALLIDIGTTTTDIIPIVDGAVVARGWTDPDRLASGELVYTGALRTPVEAILGEVPYAGGTAAVSAEGFALAGDVHVWRGALDPRDYTVPTPDGRPAAREFCAERLARIVCADTQMIDPAGISRIAAAVADAQIARIMSAIARILARHATLHIAVVTGLGAFIADAAARRAGLQVVHLADELTAAASRCAPAAAVALLLDRQAAPGLPERLSGGPRA